MRRCRVVRALKRSGLVVALLALLPVGLRSQVTPLPEGAIQVPGGTGAWVDGPPSLPAGTEMLVLEGHPAEAGMFTIRLRVSAGTRLQPHWHPREERVTVLSGLVRVGFGERFDEQAMTTFGPGSFYVNPPLSRHFVWVVEDTVMQLTGSGPWELHLLGEPDR
jgi:hypothetical protein